MDGTLLKPMRDGEPQLSAANRALLRGAGVSAVNIIGGMGSGKTSLIRWTLQSPRPKPRLGVVTADPTAAQDMALLRRHAPGGVVQVDAGAEGVLSAARFGVALGRLDLRRVDVLLVENVDPLTGPAGVDLGQDAVAVVCSVGAGDLKASKCRGLIATADVVVLNKVDLLGVVAFDLAGFRENVRRINPAARLIELSTLSGAGTAEWQDWLTSPDLRNRVIPSRLGEPLRRR